MLYAIDALALLGGWVTLLAGSAAWIVGQVWRGWSMVAANWLLSLSVILFYYSIVLRYLLTGQEQGFAWGLQFTRFDVSAVVIPVGLFFCWFGGSRWVKGLGATIIVSGLVHVYPGIIYPVEVITIGE